ncbi:MAG: sigma-54-dependent Fis family transcriptional regulator [Sphingobacteriales bacterium]|nr:MAG: sigma-54-dependent Fis family transcriptional regulator [Sphingobacteriales bacterium]
MDVQSIKSRFGIIGNAPALNHALEVANQVAGTDLTVLIAGESGVGKEAFSAIIHALSPRKHNPFIAVNCGAIPEGTIDSELFGHEKGAFTGAVDARKGYFETVNGGTIFLDEIGEMPIGTQARLLRVLETGEFIRVGSSKVQKTNVRVIAATNRDLLDFTRTGKFREDLYYRLSTVPIRVPALRDRQEDTLLLFRKFAADFSDKYRTPGIQLDASAQQMLLQYPWPGNIRELKNIAEQVSVLSTDRVVTGTALERFLPQAKAISENLSLPAISSLSTSQAGQEFTATERDILYKLFFDLKRDLNDLKQALFGMTGTPNGPVPETMLNSYPAPPNGGYAAPSYPTPLNRLPSAALTPVSTAAHEDAQEVEESLSISDVEKELIIKALRKHRGRRRDAASELGISERTLYRKIKEYDITD